MAALTFGMADTGVLVHEPGIDGHLRLIGPGAGKRAAGIVEHFQSDAELAILSPAPSRLLSDHYELAEYHTTAHGAVSCAALVHGILHELDERVEDDECDLIVVIEQLDALVAPALGPRLPEGTFDEVNRLAAIYLRTSLETLIEHGPARGVAVIATFDDLPYGKWANTSTITCGEYGQTFERDGRTTPFTWV